MKIFRLVRIYMVGPMVTAPPKDSPFIGQRTAEGQNKLKKSTGFKGLMGKITVVTEANAHSSHNIHENCNKEGSS